MGLTKQEAIENHRKLWHWIAERTREWKYKVEKWEYYKFFAIPETNIPDYGCYCCKYDGQYNPENKKLDRCVYCPIKWTSHSGKCVTGEFGEWDWLEDYQWERAAELAEIIANLPEMVFEDET